MPLGAALEKAGMPQLSPTWGGAEGGGSAEQGGLSCHIPGAQGERFWLLGALSLFRQEMAADLGLLETRAGGLTLSRWVGQVERNLS